MKLWEAMKCLEEGKKVIHKLDKYSIGSLDELWGELEFMNYDQMKFWEDGWEIYKVEEMEEIIKLVKELITNGNELKMIDDLDFILSIVRDEIERDILG